MADKDKQDPPKGQEQDGDDDNKTVTLTQKQLDEIAAKANSRGKRAGKTDALTELSEKLGGKSVEEILALAEKAQAEDEAAKSEVQKAQDEAKAEKAAAAKEREEAAKEKHDAKVERALLRAGASDASLKYLRLDLPVGADDETIAEAVEQAKADVPAAFEPASADDADKDKKDPPKGGDPGKQNPGTKQAQGEWGADGKAEFEARKAARAPVSQGAAT